MIYPEIRNSRHGNIDCNIFFHIPKTAGQTFQNLISREYRDEAKIDTNCRFLVPAEWRTFQQKLAPSAHRPAYRAVTGHMKFGVHEMVSGPSRYVTMLRDPVKRFASYYYMMRRLGIAAPDHRFDPARPDWNMPGHETISRELDNGQTRALANADWDLPFGHCSEEHLKAAQCNLDRHFAFVGLTEHFDLSLMLLKRILGWRWHFYVPKNVARPAKGHQPLPSEILDAVGRLNRFDQRLYAYARDRFFANVRHYGAPLRIEHGAYVAGKAAHQRFHAVWFPLKQKLKKKVKAVPAGPELVADSQVSW